MWMLLSTSMTEIKNYLKYHILYSILQKRFSMSIIALAGCFLIIVVAAVAAGIYFWMTDREK